MKLIIFAAMGIIAGVWAGLARELMIIFAIFAAMR
tara:strand:+ start:294 stop:398 length:105 start_codon:yes stop_codon:yes gene_type:complete